MACGEKLPREVVDALFDDSIVKFAFNANFERVCLSHYFKKTLSPKAWRCTMVWAAYLGLPLSLRDVGIALNLENKKMVEGKDLIKYFCSPCAPTKTNGFRTRNLPSDAPAKWELFKKYNIRSLYIRLHHNSMWWSIQRPSEVPFR